MDDLEKLYKDLNSYDPHFRQNAVRFLAMKFDQERNTLKEDEKKRILDALLSRLDPKEDSLEVKGVTVREFGKLAKILKDNEIIQIFTKIISFITDPKAVGRDIYVACIKELLKDMEGGSCLTVGNIILPEINKGIQTDSNEIKELCFDTFDDYINTFNYVLIKDSERVIKNKDFIIKKSLETIKIDSPSLRKVVSSFLGNFSSIMNKHYISLLLDLNIKKINESETLPEKIAYMNTLANIARNSAPKQADHLRVIIPILLKFCSLSYLNKSQEASSDEYDLTNELVETSLSILETYILKLTNQLKPHAGELSRMLIELLVYDPHYSYSDEMEIDDPPVEEDYGYDEYAYEYDAFVVDDSSWKVRRGAVRAIFSFIKSRMQMDRVTLVNIVDNLVANIREHEENTKLDIIHCLSAYLRSFVIEEEHAEEEDGLSLQLEHKQSAVTNILPAIQQLVKNFPKELKSKNKNVKLAIIRMLGSLAIVDSTELIRNFSVFKDDIQSIYTENNELALNTLTFLGRLLKNIKDCSEISKYLDILISFFEKGVKSEYYKINVECSNYAFHLVRVTSEITKNSNKELMNKFYNLLLPKFKSNDVDHELKISLIGTMGNIMLYFGNDLQKEQITQLFQIYFDKNKIENLRTLSLKWLSNIISGNSSLTHGSNISKNISVLLEDIIKYNVHSQYHTLEFLNTVLIYAPKLLEQMQDQITETLLQITSEESLIPSSYAILNQLNFDKKHAEMGMEHTIKLLEMHSHTTVGVDAMFTFLHRTVQVLDSKKTIKILDGMMKSNDINLNKARCIGVLAMSTNTTDKIVKSCIDNLSSKAESVQGLKTKSLLVLGETCLASDKPYNDVYSFLEKMLSSHSDEFKTSIAACLGKLAVNNMQEFVGKFTKITDKDTITFSFIAIRECLQVISKRENWKKLDDKIKSDLVNTLVHNTEHENEKIRLLSGESLGLISLISMDVLGLVNNKISSGSSKVRAILLYGLKFIFSANKYDAHQLDETQVLLFKGLDDDDIKVRQYAFSSLINFVHNYSHMVKTKQNCFIDLWSLFLKYYQIKPELIEVVDIGGGMKIKDDKGLVIRKAIYSSTKIMLDHIPEKINIADALNLVLNGFKDHEDIQVLCHGCLLRMSHIAPEAFISNLENLVDIFSAKLNSLKNPAEKGGKDAKVDRKKISIFCEDVKRLFDELKRVPEIDENPKFTDFSFTINKTLSGEI